MATMEIEFHLLDLRYENLRRRNPEQEKRLLASLAQHGQQTPVVVVVAADCGQRVLVDGYKRVRALKALKMDTVLATVWDLAEAEALLLEQLMRCASGDGPLELARLLRELHERFELSQEELARRFDKSQSWVSRLLALAKELPEEIQEQVQAGAIVAHAAVKYLVPMARAKRADAVQLVAALKGQRPSTRQMGALYGAWLRGGTKCRELLLKDPWIFLKAQEELQRAKSEPSVTQLLRDDLGALGGIARRVSKRLRDGAAQELATAEQDEIRRCLLQAKADTAALFALGEKELNDA
jgi:ParB/RepB/Spo0J family partition protein